MELLFPNDPGLSDHTKLSLALLMGSTALLYTYWIRSQGQSPVQKSPSAYPQEDSDAAAAAWPPTPPEKHWLWKHALALRAAPGDASSHDIIFGKWMQRLQSKVVMFEVPVLGRLIVIGDAALAKEVLLPSSKHSKQRCYFPKSPTYQKNRPLLGSKSLVTMEGDEWALHRKLFAPGFAPDHLKTMVSTLVEKVERLVRVCDTLDVAHRQPTHLLDRAIDLTSDVISQVAFGEDWGSDGSHQQPPKQTLADFRELIDLIAALKNPLERFNLQSRRRMKQLEVSVDADMKALVERRIARLQTSRTNEKDKTATPPKDILSLALFSVLSEEQQQQQPSEPQNPPTKSISISDEAMEGMISQLKTFYFAGHDTTATTIAWAFWSLLQHPKALETARREVLDQLGPDWVAAVAQPPKDDSSEFKPILPRDSITYEMLQNCHYLDAVAKETLRLYPPAQTARHSFDHPDATLGNYKVGGSVLVVNCYAIQRDPDLWGPDAHLFRPDRFLGSSGKALQNSFGFLPFSRGTRDCIGKYFALLEIKIALAALVTRYNGQAVRPDEEVYTARLTSIPKNGCLVQLEHRSAPPPTALEEQA